VINLYGGGAKCTLLRNRRAGVLLITGDNHPLLAASKTDVDIQTPRTRSRFRAGIGPSRMEQ
jgi:hypothetical protein